ncbi:S41 family peptidase [Anaerotignum lactatifermentans]|uniref:S41 family peptidase n=1 Tax=Anaerotignum lactatifermentans TaxID=160404 RepID=A0ABS2G6F6_9FIRM|nr:S41 family peptidase [Anaerotignum lactatifermentans]MBM6828714.1 S41 family peptidase [Anaerotignum lactatifermentans]MBM6877041.1 S41 family peptidase [Anaerotignum lactatifermentans]MBM6950296.1 S41 family peptidase [Anaerotignum lactatifermentans]
MRNKNFWKGFAAAVAVMVVVTFGGGALVHRGVVPLDWLPDGLARIAKTNILLDYLEENYVDEFNSRMAEELMYTGLAAGAGDTYTYYLSAEMMAQQTEKNSGHFVGIGVDVTVNEEGYCQIVSVTAGGPAEAAGIQTGDVIVEVDGESVDGVDANEVVSRIKGEEGTEVALGVRRGEDILTLTVTRQDIQVTTVEGRMLEDGIGYISISAFRENTYDQFREALDALLAEGMEGLVLDLRDNTGGLVPTAYEIGEELLPEGTMVYTLDKEGNRKDLVCDAQYLDLPLVVLVNGYSASASEILAGAIQDTGRGELIGTQTFGKGLIQRLYTLSDGSGINVTIQKYYTPNGTSIHGVGLTPDLVVEQPEEGGEDLQLAAALSRMAEKMN